MDKNLSEVNFLGYLVEVISFLHKSAYFFDIFIKNVDSFFLMREIFSNGCIFKVKIKPSVSSHVKSQRVKTIKTAFMDKLSKS